MRIGRAQHRKTFDAGAQSHRDVAQDRRSFDAVHNRSVAGHDQRRFLAGRLQCPRQRADHVGETAGFCVRGGFRRNDRYLHEISFPRARWPSKTYAPRLDRSSIAARIIFQIMPG